MNALLAVPIVVPLAGAVLSLGFVQRRSLQRVVGLASIVVALAASVGLLVEVEADGPVATQLGGWQPMIAITLAADLFAALLLLVALTVVAAVLVYAIGQRSADERSPFYVPVYLVLAAGLGLAFLTADLFNLFVAVELLLIASYVLITLEGSDAQIRAGTTYVVLNLIESTILLLAVGLVYAAAGTVSFAELPERIAEMPDGVRLGLNLLLLVAFGLKAGVFPLFFWLPDSYPAAPSPVSAVFAGLLTKLGVYAIIRVETLLFPDSQRELLLLIGALTMIVGVLGAIAQTDMKRILSFHIVSQIGYMIIGIGIGGVAGLAATVLFVLHQIPTKTSLFLVEGIIERESGTGALDEVSGYLHRSAMLGGLFLLSALSLSGFPPFSGFLGKFGLVRAAALDDQWFALVVALAGSILTLVSMTKIWVGVFWGEPEPVRADGQVGVLRHHRLMGGATTAVVGVGLALALLGGPLVSLCTRAAATLVDPSPYLTAVAGA